MQYTACDVSDRRNAAQRATFLLLTAFCCSSTCLLSRCKSGTAPYPFSILKEDVPITSGVSQCLTTLRGANTQFGRKETYGKGAIVTVKNAKSEVAHWNPNLLYTMI